MGLVINSLPAFPNTRFYFKIQSSEFEIMRTIAILSYFFIFLPGSMILIPFGLLLLAGLFTAEPLLRVLLGLADIALITIFIYSYKPYSRTRLLIEIGSFITLILPLALMLINFSWDWFNYWLFWIPLVIFTISFPISIYQTYKKHLLTKT